MFVQWWQWLFLKLWKTDEEKDLLLNAFWKHYKLTFTTLVTFWWAIFASFPIFYATSFGWAYLVWILLLFVFIIQAVSYEYRKKMNNFLWKKVYEYFLIINWLLWPLLLGVAVWTFFTWSNFSIETSNMVNPLASNYIISSWTSNFYWLEALWNMKNWAFITNISLWLILVFITRISAILYIIYHIDNSNIIKNSKKCLIINSILFLIFFLIFIIKLLTIPSFSYTWNSIDTTIINIESFWYLNNFLQMPIVSIMFILWVILFLLWIYLWYFKNSWKGFWINWLWTVLVVISILLIAWFSWTSFYPSLEPNLNDSLTIQNSSSSKYTLIVMSRVSLIIPFVIAYIIWAWIVISPKKMTKEDLSKELEQY